MGGEIFSQARMNKCAEIHRKMVNRVIHDGKNDIVLRAVDSVHGITLDELRTRYFEVGIPGDVTEVPFTDLIVLIQMLEQHGKAIKARGDSPLAGATIQYQIATIFTDEEAVRLLSLFPIETPHDAAKVLRIRKSDPEQ